MTTIEIEIQHEKANKFAKSLDNTKLSNAISDIATHTENIQQYRVLKEASSRIVSLDEQNNKLKEMAMFLFYNVKRSKLSNNGLRIEYDNLHKEFEKLQGK